MTVNEHELLHKLNVSYTRGVHAVACDGVYRAAAHSLEATGYVEWCGECWGSSFWMITEKGRLSLAQTHSNS